MSVLVPDDNFYNKVAASVRYRIASNKVYCYPYNSNYTEDALETMVRNEVEQLRVQNYLSYDKRYNEQPEYIAPIKYYDTSTMTAIQLYKALQCILYNIETDYKSLFITKFMESLSTAIIDNLPEYKEVKWGEV